MARKSSQMQLTKLRLSIAYVIYCCMSLTTNLDPPSSLFAQALVYQRYQPVTLAPVLSRVNRQPTNISASESYYNSYQGQAYSRQQQPQQLPAQQNRQQQQQQTSYLTSSESNDELGQDFYGCPVECHCNTIAHIADCSDRNLTRVPARFPKDIKRIRLERNNITEIGAYAFQGLKRLQRIDLSNNNLYKIDTLAFSGGLQALNTLILFNNKLEHLPVNVFSELSNLQILLLNANSLQTINKDLFQSLTNLNLLSLYDNDIVNLASGTFDALKSVKTIHLGKNPLNCDCNLRWLVDYFVANPTVETSEARCELPSRSQGKRLSQLNKSELKCQETASVSKSPVGDQSSFCPAGCICSGSTVDCSRAGPSASSEAPALGPGGGLYELPDVPDDLPVYVARVHINDNRIKRIRQTGLFKKLANSQKLDLGNNKIVDVEDNAINGRLPNGQKPERVIFVLLENQHCERPNGSSVNSGRTSASTRQAATVEGFASEDIHSTCALAPKVNEPQFDSPCYNGGACKPSAGGNNFTCLCPAGFGGPLCELNIDDCVDHQCQNGAMCVDGINSYKCICRDPTTSGEFCEQLNSNNNNNLLLNSLGSPYSQTSGAASNLIAPLALPMIASSSGGLASVTQSNELGSPSSLSSEQHGQRTQQPQILARSADFMRHSEDLGTNSLQQSSMGTAKACQRATTSRYFEDGNGCQSVRLLKMSECAGSCDSKTGGGCCVPTKIKRRRIHMQCSDGASYVKVVDLVKKCSCSQEVASCPATGANELLLPQANGRQSSSTAFTTTRAASLQTNAYSTQNQLFKYQTGGDHQAYSDGYNSQQASRNQPASNARENGDSANIRDDQLGIARLDAVE